MRRLFTLIVSIFSASLSAAEPLPEGALLRLGTTNLRGCSGTFNFTPDGKHIAVVHGEKADRVTIYDAATGKPLRTLAPGGPVRCLSFSPDGKRLLPSSDGNLDTVVWDVHTGREVGRVAGTSARFADQGRKIVTHQARMQVDGQRVIGVFDGNNYRWLENREVPARLTLSHVLEPTHSARRLDKAWEIASFPSGKVVFTAPCAENARGGGFHDDGKLFVFSDRSGIHVWGVKTGRKIRSIAARTDSVVDVSADGKQLGWSAYDEKEGIAFAWVCDLAGGTPRHVGPATNSFHPVLFSPDGRRLAILTESHAVVLRDVRTGKDVFPSSGHTGWVGKVHFTPDGRHVVSRDRHAILVWERDTGRLLRRLPDDLPGGELPIIGTLAADFVVTVAPDGTLRKRDLVTGREVRVLAGKHGFVFGAAEPASVSQDGKVLALVSRDYNIRAYDLSSGKVLLDFEPPCAVWDVFLSPRGQGLAWSSQNHPKGDRIWYLDVSSGREIEREKLPASALPLANERGRWLPLDDLLPRLRDLGLANKEGRVTLDRWIDKPYRVCLSREGRYLLASRFIRGDDFVGTGPQEINLAIWEIATGRRLPPLISDRQFTEVASFSPDGRLLVATSLQGSIHLWELATGKERVVLRGHLPDSVYAIAFSPDSRYLLSGGNDTQVFLWDLWGRKGKPTAGLPHAAARTRELYEQLLDPEARKAGRAMIELAADPAGTLPFLRAQVKLAPKPDLEQAARLIRELDSDDYNVREKASEKLGQMGDVILGVLKDARKKGLSLEQHRRIERLIDAVSGPTPRGEPLRTLRVVELVERIGTGEARKLLESWATGTGEARLTQEAKAALGRCGVSR